MSRSRAALPSSSFQTSLNGGRLHASTIEDPAGPNVCSIVFQHSSIPAYQHPREGFNVLSGLQTEPWGHDGAALTVSGLNICLDPTPPRKATRRGHASRQRVKSVARAVQTDLLNGAMSETKFMRCAARSTADAVSQESDQSRHGRNKSPHFLQPSEGTSPTYILNPAPTLAALVPISLPDSPHQLKLVVDIRSIHSQVQSG